MSKIHIFLVDISGQCDCPNCQRRRHKFSKAWWTHFHQSRLRYFRRLLAEAQKEIEEETGESVE